MYALPHSCFCFFTSMKEKVYTMISVDKSVQLLG